MYAQTPLHVCEQRSVKGMHPQARKVIIKDLTVINAFYKDPLNPEVVLDTVNRAGKRVDYS